MQQKEPEAFTFDGFDDRQPQSFTFDIASTESLSGTLGENRRRKESCCWSADCSECNNSTDCTLGEIQSSTVNCRYDLESTLSPHPVKQQYYRRKNLRIVTPEQRRQVRERLSNMSTEARQLLLRRLKDYEARGLVNREDHKRYRQLLSKSSMEEESRYSENQVNRELDRIVLAEPTKVYEESSSVASTMTSSHHESSSIYSKRHQRQPESILVRNKKLTTQSAGLLIRKHHVSWEDQSEPSTSLTSPTLDATTRSDQEDRTMMANKYNREEQENNNKMVLDPSDLWGGNVDMDEQQLQKLFVEMCFFARLGYVQPPCCLRCTYRCTQHRQTTAAPDCPRWVVWRKNAKTLLDPDCLDGNIVIVQCQAAQQLLRGKVVEGRKWDAAYKTVVAAQE